MSRIAYVGLTTAFFLVSAAVYGLCGWIGYGEAAAAQRHVPAPDGFALQMAREIALNWQAVALQVLWQAAGLAWVLRLGSRAGERRAERVERKLDALLHYLALHRERQEIDASGGRGEGDAGRSDAQERGTGVRDGASRD